MVRNAAVVDEVQAIDLRSLDKSQQLAGFELEQLAHVSRCSWPSLTGFGIFSTNSHMPVAIVAETVGEMTKRSSASR